MSRVGRALGGLCLLALRVGLGVLFVWAASSKIADPQSFALSVKSYGVLPEAREHAIVLAAFVIPWAEMIAGVCLVLGLRARGAALVIAGLLLAFLYGELRVISAGKDVECGCFGDANWPCSGPIGWCHVGRNLVLLLAAVLLTVFGGGWLAVDQWLDRRRVVVVDPERKRA